MAIDSSLKKNFEEFYQRLLPFLNKQSEDSGGGSSEEYSTEEQVIGKWIDGKPVYQKTFILASQIVINGSAFTRVFSISDVSDYISVQSGWSFFNAAYFKPGDLGQWATLADTIGTIPKGTSITVRYTKTTD